MCPSPGLGVNCGWVAPSPRPSPAQHTSTGKPTRPPRGWCRTQHTNKQPLLPFCAWHSVAPTRRWGQVLETDAPHLSSGSARTFAEHGLHPKHRQALGLRGRRGHPTTAQGTSRERQQGHRITQLGRRPDPTEAGAPHLPQLHPCWCFAPTPLAAGPVQAAGEQPSS